jgi:hypothetical protein
VREITTSLRENAVVQQSKIARQLQLWVIFDRSDQSCLLGHVRFAPKADCLMFSLAVRNHATRTNSKMLPFRRVDFTDVVSQTHKHCVGIIFVGYHKLRPLLGPSKPPYYLRVAPQPGGGLGADFL